MSRRAVASCWLLAALACVAGSIRLAQGVCYKGRSERGKYVRLFGWQKRKFVNVAVDEFIPLTAKGREMLFAANGHELWVSMLEKALPSSAAPIAA